VLREVQRRQGRPFTLIVVLCAIALGILAGMVVSGAGMGTGRCVGR
jgi:hypothetical protein